jgi:hypothetical protein
VCANGLIIGETRIEIKERHNQNLDLNVIDSRIISALETVAEDRSRMIRWQGEKITIDKIADLANAEISARWGKKAATRVFNICKCGRDVEISLPYTKNAASKQPVGYKDRVRGSPERAATKYDVAQALSFVATSRTNTEERAAWQAEIPAFLL